MPRGSSERRQRAAVVLRLARSGLAQPGGRGGGNDRIQSLRLRRRACAALCWRVASCEAGQQPCLHRSATDGVVNGVAGVLPPRILVYKSSD